MWASFHNDWTHTVAMLKGVSAQTDKHEQDI